MYRNFRKDPLARRGKRNQYLLQQTFIALMVMFSFVMQVNANSFAQRLNLSLKNASLKDVMTKIQQQTGYDFIFTQSARDKMIPVTIDVNNVDLSEVLEQIFKKQPLDYKVTDNSIIITEKKEKPSLLDRIRDIIVRGKVVDEKGNGLPGATIRLKGDETKMAITSSSAGDFAVNVPGDNAVLVVSYIGYQTKEVTVSGASVDLVIRMEPGTAELKGVEVVSTGYQDIPKERATGSFEKIDNALLNRSTGASVLQRLENVTSGLLIDRRLNGNGTPGIGQVTIRGMSTMTPSMTAPLVVLDNFPYEGDVNNINPNDIESVTILKDAAAGSIWGARAANGVIVLTTKKGQYNKKTNVNFNANVNITERPDLFSRPTISTSDYIDLEKDLFDKGFFDNKINDVFSWPYLSPVVELLVKTQGQNPILTRAEADSQINVFRNRDIKRDYLKYVYRPAVAQQYALGINGGGNNFSYQISGGYDNNITNVIKASSDRITLRTAFSYKPIKNLEFDFSSIYTQIKSSDITNKNPLQYNEGAVLPYDQLMDENGNPTIIGKNIGERFLINADPRYLDWRYRPLAELNSSSYKQNSADILMNIGARYQLSKIISASVKYQYTQINAENKNLDGPESYYTRDYINSLTVFNGDQVTRHLPLGGILGQTFFKGGSYNVRGQINADKNWGTDHQLNVLGGLEQKESRSRSSGSILYGYNDNTLIHSEVDNMNYFLSPLFSLVTMPSGQIMTDRTNRFQSIFANAAYTYKQRYTVSASGRRDAANIYGVSTNLRGAPFWSTGLSWNISNESFYKGNMIPYLKIRATYGYQGNTDNNLTAYSTISYNSGFNDFAVNLPFADIQNPANDALRWERVGTLNLGLDFGFKNGVISGSLEYYKKSAKDVLSLTPIDYTTGFSFATTNNAKIRSNGVDLNLQTRIIRHSFKWDVNLFFNYNNNRVVQFTPINNSIGNFLGTNLSIPSNFITGRPLLGLYAYRWAGLDPQTGDPLGYLAGEKSKDYAALTTVLPDQLEYHGSAVPIYSGALRHSFSYHNITLSVNITGKFGYVFRRPGINYSAIFNSQNRVLGLPHADLTRRWQNPGDELITDIPSLTYPGNILRDNFYKSSSTLISKGDHIRLQDINISYRFSQPAFGLSNVKFFVIGSNLGIIWRSNKYDIDPDYQLNFPAQKIFSLGLSANF